MKVSPGRITANIPHPDTSELLCISLQYRPADTTEIFSSESVKIGTLLFANIGIQNSLCFFIIYAAEITSDGGGRGRCKGAPIGKYSP